MDRFPFTAVIRTKYPCAGCISGLAILWAISSLALPAIITVPSDVPTIQVAADLAADGHEIHILGGQYDESVEIVGKRLTLRANSSFPSVSRLR